jgi:hypothetical protein
VRFYYDDNGYVVRLVGDDYFYLNGEVAGGVVGGVGDVFSVVVGEFVGLVDEVYYDDFYVNGDGCYLSLRGVVGGGVYIMCDCSPLGGVVTVVAVDGTSRSSGFLWVDFVGVGGLL